MYTLQACTPNLGSTDVWRPLHALQLLSDTSHTHSTSLPGDTTTLPPRSLFLISDGHVTEEGSTLTAIKQGLKHFRLFTFGVRLVSVDFSQILINTAKILF